METPIRCFTPPSASIATDPFLTVTLVSVAENSQGFFPRSSYKRADQTLRNRGTYSEASTEEQRAIFCILLRGWCFQCFCLCSAFVVNIIAAGRILGAVASTIPALSS